MLSEKRLIKNNITLLFNGIWWFQTKYLIWEVRKNDRLTLFILSYEALGDIYVYVLNNRLLKFMNFYQHNINDDLLKDFDRCC